MMYIEPNGVILRLCLLEANICVRSITNDLPMWLSSQAVQLLENTVRQAISWFTSSSSREESSVNVWPYNLTWAVVHMRLNNSKTRSSSLKEHI